MKLIAFSPLILLSSTIMIAPVAEPPKLVATSPSFWAVGVDSSRQKAISLTFDQRMRPGFSSWLGRSSLAPDSNSPASISDDQLTFGLAVDLQPAKVYVFALNEKGIPGIGFQNEKGLSLSSTFLVFQTAGIPAADDVPPRVARITPSNGSQELDPTRTRSVVIAFDQPMNAKKHGLHVFENNNAVDISKLPFAYSADGLTFTLPYNFRIGTQYRLELNNTNDIGFARANRIPLWPVQITFSTGSPK